MADFRISDRVRVSDDFFWAKGALGTVGEHPLGGKLTQQEESALGMNTVYWIWFDLPQFDADGEGPYRAGQIWETALTLI